jgi:hypothetical protein
MIQFDWDRRGIEKTVDDLKHKGHVATEAAVIRIGEYVARRARHHAAKDSHRMANEVYVDGHVTPLGYTVLVGSHAPYSLFVENGFQGHFVPFHVSDSLYHTALERWGWRIPDPAELPKAAVSSRRYLIPMGRKKPVWGVYVSGKAQPFLRPALFDMRVSHVDYRFLKEEFGKQFR